MTEQFATCLNNHPVLKSLSEKLKTKEQTKCLGLITLKNDVLYIWNESEKCVVSIDERLIIKGKNDTEFVSLVPSPSPYFDVENVSVNTTSTVLCLYGSNGICVTKLPDRWLLKEKRVDVPSDYLAQRTFLCDHHVLRRFKWHPGSPTDSHFVILTSDEVLRVYNALDAAMVWQCRLTENAVHRSLPSKVSIGETPIDFDFTFCEAYEDGRVDWPVLALWGNGDVYYINTTLEQSDSNLVVEGPLRISPTAQDNYGSDASSICVLETTPPLVAISTCSGVVHHCLLLPEESSSDEEKILYVFETLELELGVSIGVEREDDIVSYPVRLEKDPNQTNRYFCLHNAGVQSVALPIVTKLERLLKEDSTTFDASGIQSSCENLLCTGLTSGTETSCSPILGVAYLDFTKILVLLSCGKLIYIPLLNRFDSQMSENDKDVETVAEIRQDDFQSIIDILLKENGISNSPIFKLPGEGTRPQDWHEIVCKTTRSLRTVLSCHSEVALKLQQRSESLKIQLKRLTENMEKLGDDRSSLRSTAEQIAERYEEINEKQNSLIKRTEKLLCKIECSGEKTASINEKRMATVLEKAKVKIGQLDRDIQAVQSFYVQLEQVNAKHTEEARDLPQGYKVQLLYKNLKHLNNELTDLIKRVESSNQIVSQCHFPNE